MCRPFEEGAYIARNYDGRIELVNVYCSNSYRDGGMLARSTSMSCGVLLKSSYWEGWTWSKVPTYEDMDKLQKIINSFATIMRLAVDESNKEINVKENKG